MAWSSSIDGGIGTGTSFSKTDLSVGSHTITLTGTDPEGATGSASVSITVLPNQPPVASITGPSDGSSFVESLSITFSGSATDPEDGPLSGNALAWTSNLDGSIGNGASFSRTDLSVGTHDVTLTATDSRGEAGTAMISVVVLPSLTGTWAGQDTADFTWKFALTEDVASGSVSGQAQIYQGQDLTLDGGVVTGSVSGVDIELSITFPGYNVTIYTATIAEDRNSMAGVLNGSGFEDEPLTMERSGVAPSGGRQAFPVAAPGDKSLAEFLKSLSGKGGTPPGI